VLFEEKARTRTESKSPSEDDYSFDSRHVVEYCANGMHPMISNGLFDSGGYAYSTQARSGVQRVIARAWKGLDYVGYIEEPDPNNGKNGYRVPSPKALPKAPGAAQT
jgi:hypothetical protein